MTNPAQAIRALVTYAICIPLAAIVGWMLCNPLDFGTLGFFGLIALLLASPIFIKWHYQLMIFALGSPIICFFLKGAPPLPQVMVMLSLGIAVIDRTINSDRQFRSPAVMVWPLLFTAAVAYITSQLTGGIGLKALGGEVAGGKKYIALFIGVATFFALTSRYIPKEQRKFYVMLYFLPGVLQFVSDVFPYLPSPLNYVNLLIPPSDGSTKDDFAFGSRMGAVAASAGVVANYMIARYGIRGVFRGDQPIRCLLVVGLLFMTLMGGFRIILVSYGMLFGLLFFVEGLHRTRFLLVAILGVIVGSSLLVTLSDKLPYSFQRTLTVLPFLKLDPGAIIDAEGSRKWRQDMWADTWPKVPEHLLLGKGYALSKDDFLMMGDGVFSGGIQMQMDKSMTALAISGDYHNGPLSTLMPFGIWGAISILWVMAASLYIVVRNYRYGDADLKTVNAFLMVVCIQRTIGFFFLFGAYAYDIGEFAKLAGFSIALNWGICAAKAQSPVITRIKPLRQPRPQPVIA